MWKEFREFIGRGNVLGLAVALVMGAAFGAVVASFTNDILMQLIAAIGAKPNFSGLSVNVNGTPIRYGNFLTALLSFLIVSFAIFLMVKAANRLQRRTEEKKEAKETETDLLKQIRDELRARNPVHT
jgi:large conductance mechanosensitive channel